MDNSANIENKDNAESDKLNNGLTQESQNSELSEQDDIDDRILLFATNEITKTAHPAQLYRDPDLHYSEI